MPAMDEVFKAIDDPSRRLLLDRLFDKDGQTLGEMCEHLPSMTRFGVMNHLRVLEGAGLVTTRKAGRSKLHYLNPVPIRLVHDRWISKYAAPLVGGVARLKARLEGGSVMSEPVHVYQSYIRAPIDDVWNAIVDGDQTVRYFYGTRVASGWAPGDEIRYEGADGAVLADGSVLSIDPPHKLEMTFHARWDAELEAEGPVREVWLLEDADGVAKLTIELYDAALGSKTLTDFTQGFPYIVAGLKTLLETGTPMSA
jgi:uncharacterized protein YndB with AHSA1/START domain/DNA-binding transcriptional ArsR family regulator